MTQCKSIKSQKKRICISDLNKKIEIQTSYFQNSDAPNTDSGLIFNTILNPWSLVKTRGNINYNNGVNSENSITHLFYIRYNSSLDFTQELFVRYDNRIFKVNTIENIGEENKYFVLYAIERGEEGKKASER
jgi:head-tail adaptor